MSMTNPAHHARISRQVWLDGIIPPAKETFSMLKEEILRLVRLVQDFQKLTLAEAAKVYLRREEIQLSHLVKRVIELYRHDFEVKGIRVNLDFNGEPCAVQADRDKIVQALGNIVQNAWRYTSRARGVPRPGGRV